MTGCGMMLRGIHASWLVRQSRGSSQNHRPVMVATATEPYEAEGAA